MTIYEEAIYVASIQMEMTVIEHQRSIYTWWDFLGDVGGLFGILQSIAYPFITVSSLLLNTGIDQFLIESLFKVQKRMDYTHKLDDYIKRRKSVRLILCNWLFDRKNRRVQ